MVHMYMAGLNLCFLSNAHGHPKMYVLSRPRVQRGSYQTFQVTTGQLHMKKSEGLFLTQQAFPYLFCMFPKQAHSASCRIGCPEKVGDRRAPG